LPPMTEGKLELRGVAKQAAEEIKSLSPTSAAHKEIPLDALSVAQLGTGNPDAALHTLETAIRSDPRNPRLHYLRALALRQLGQTTEAIQSLQNARATLSPGTDVELSKNIYNSLAFTLLYLPPPQGFTECATICHEYLQQDPQGIDGAMWVNLACAHGQGARYARENKNEENFNDHRREALTAIRKALSIDMKWLPRLAGLFRPTPQQKAAREDDLATFQGDSEFESELGKRA